MKNKNKKKIKCKNLDGLKFIEFWVNYMKTHKDWDRQQNALINSQLKNALTDKKVYLKMKAK